MHQTINNVFPPHQDHPGIPKIIHQPHKCQHPEDAELQPRYSDSVRTAYHTQAAFPTTQAANPAARTIETRPVTRTAPRTPPHSPAPCRTSSSIIFLTFTAHTER